MDNSAVGNWKKTFFAMWLGQSLVIIKSSVASFALVWYVTMQTESGTVLAVLTLMTLLPKIVVAPFAGVIIDKFSRKRIMIIANIVVAAVSLFMSALFAMEYKHIVFLFLLALVNNCCSVFLTPAVNASLPLIAPKQQISRLVSFTSFTHHVENLVGPVLGAILVKIMPMSVIMAILGVIAILAVIPLLFVFIPDPDKAAVVNNSRKKGNFLQDFTNGFKYLLKWPALLMLVIFGALFSFISYPPGTLFPLLVLKYGGDETALLASINVAYQAGMIGCVALFTIWKGFKRKIISLMSGTWILGLGILIFTVPIVVSYYVKFSAGAVLFGFGSQMLNITLITLILTEVEKSIQARIYTVFVALTSILSPLGLAIAGPLADQLGVGIIYRFSGITALIMGLVIFLIPDLRNFEKNRPDFSQATGGENPEQVQSAERELL